MMNIRIDAAGLADISAINKIQKLAFKASYDKYRFCPAFEAEDDHLVAYMEWARIYKILYDGEIIGSIFIYKAEDHHYELDSISIIPQYQNAGIGVIAIALAESLYPDAKLWTLATPDSDHRNRHFYEKLGYVEFETEIINSDLKLIRYKKEIASL